MWYPFLLLLGQRTSYPNVGCAILQPRTILSFLETSIRGSWRRKDPNNYSVNGSRHLLMFFLGRIDLLLGGISTCQTPLACALMHEALLNW